MFYRGIDMENWLEMSFEKQISLWEFFFLSFFLINHDRMPSWGDF